MSGADAEHPEIERIAPLPRDATRWRVEAGGATIATLDRRSVDELRLAVGVVVTPEIARGIARAAMRDEARRFALTSLARRASSWSGLETKLRQRGIEGAVATATCDDMARLGLLDDARYAEMAARAVLARGPAGRRRIEQPLRRQGVPSELAATAAREPKAGLDPLDEAIRRAERRAQRLPERLDVAARRRRLYGLLVRRGFEPDVCAAAVRRVLAAIESEETA